MMGPDQMSPTEDRQFSNLDRVKVFTVEGLANAHVSAATVESARIADRPVPWRLGSHGGGTSLEDELYAKYVSPNPGGDDLFSGTGLRLVAPLGWKGKATIDGIVKLPGYQAAADISADAAFSSFTIDPSFPLGLPSYFSRPAVPAFPWPIPINAPDDLAHLFENSHAAMRGFVLVSAAADINTASVSADIVDLNDDELAGSYLALRFMRAGARSSRLAANFSLAGISRNEPLVLLPLQGRAPEAVLTDFVYELAHNLPVDVAAWKAVRNYAQIQTPPVVLAPRAFLDRGRLSDIIPDLQARLKRFSPSSMLDISSNDLLRFNPGAFDQLDLSRPTTGFVRDFLAKSSQYVWDRESDSADSLLAITRGVEALEQDVQYRGGTSSWIPHIGWGKILDSLPSPTLGGGGVSASIDLKAILKGMTTKVSLPSTSSPEVSPASAEPSLPPERFTDAAMFDDQKRLLSSSTPLVADHIYTLDIAIRKDRIGITRGRSDQRRVAIDGQTATEKVWVVVTDESEEISDNRLKPPLAFDFDRHFAQLDLPAIGDSIGSARFALTPLRAAFQVASRRRIGVRIYHKLNLIDHVELDLLVVPSENAALPPSDRPALDAVFLGASGGISPLEPDSEPRQLNISVVRTDEGSYRFAFVMQHPRGAKPFLFGLRKLSEQTLNGYAARFRDTLLDAAFGPSAEKANLSANDCQEILKSLSLLGTEILRDLFDNQKADGDFFEIGKILRQQFLPAAAIIQISLAANAQEFIFPWQILTMRPYTDRDEPVDYKNLWGYRFIIEIKRCGDGTDRREQNQRLRVPVRMTYGRWKKFANEAQHYGWLNGLVQLRTAELKFEPVVDDKTAFIESLKAGGGDLLYIYAHGHAATPATPAGNLWRASIGARLDTVKTRIAASQPRASASDEALRDMLDQWMRATAGSRDSSIKLSLSEVTLSSLTDFGIDDGQEIRLRDSPIVILNTCDSAQLWCAVKSSFVGFFLDRGARAVLGTEATMPIVVADPFGRNVLNSMLCFQDPVGKAVLDARVGLLRDHNNPLGLSYSIFGDGAARVIAPSVSTAAKGDSP
jgi:hypothetical protein